MINPFSLMEYGKLAVASLAIRTLDLTGMRAIAVGKEESAVIVKTGTVRMESRLVLGATMSGDAIAASIFAAALDNVFYEDTGRLMLRDAISEVTEGCPTANLGKAFIEQMDHVHTEKTASEFFGVPATMAETTAGAA